MITRYYNAKILYNNEIVEGDFVVYNNLIASIGAPVMGLMPDKEVDVKGNLILPTFKNGHTHSPRIVLRSLSKESIDLGYYQNVERVLNDDAIYWLTKLAILEYLKNGIGTVSDMYNKLDPIMAASNECGIRNILMHMINDDFAKGKEIVSVYEHGLETYNSGNCKYRIGLHSEGAADYTLLKEVSALSKIDGQPVFAHLSESKVEVQKCIEKYGKTQVALFRDLGLFNSGGTVFHMVEPTEEDIQILSDMSVNVISCPSANAGSGNGICPINRLRAKGVVVGLGTDGPIANYSYDMFNEMRMAYNLQKIKYGDKHAISNIDILNMATVDGAKALGAKIYPGLSANSLADFIIVDIKNIERIPGKNLLENVLMCANGSNVLTTVVNGKVLYDSGNYYIGEDVDKIYSMCEMLVSDILKRL